MSRDTAATVTIIYWRDIPAQVIAGQGRDQHKVQLAPRFQQAIDRAAMHAGRIGTEDYLEDWRKRSTPLTGEPAEEAGRIAAELEEKYSLDALNELVENGGLEQS